MRGSLWSLSVAAIFAGIFAMSSLNAAVPDTGPNETVANSTQTTVDVLNTTSPVVGLTLFLIAIGATWVIAISRSSF